MTEASTANILVTSEEIRETLVETLELDLIGPWVGHELVDEKLPGWQRPSNWYLTGFLIPTGTPPEQAGDADSDDEMADVGEAGLGEENNDDGKAAKKSFFPSSMGLSFLVASEAKVLEVRVQWGDYAPDVLPATDDNKEIPVWQRLPREKVVAIDLSKVGEDPRAFDVPDSKGVQLVVVSRVVETSSLRGAIPAGARSVSVFLVNNREPVEPNADEAYVFQPVLLVASEPAFVPRPDLRGLRAGEWDDKVSDLHYADAPEFATGHGVSVDWGTVDGRCHLVRTEWLPRALVERTVTVDHPGVELGMDALGALKDGAAARVALMPLVEKYHAWIEEQRAGLGALSQARKETASQLLSFASLASKRIEQGIQALESDDQALEAFRTANRAVAAALKKRLGIDAPKWRAFQLAFLLLNLPGMADPTDPNRETVDLLFFPTGGGKTEAYLGLAAFSMVLRRLRNPGRRGEGMSVMMRYTLRLLTLDQLGRAAGLVCALELERQANVTLLGDFPFEIGLWVGKAATPNQMGRIGDKRQDTARSKTIQYKNNPDRKPLPIPLDECPWCGERFKPESFTLLPNDDRPKQLRIVCSSFECEFSGDNPLPILAVDDEIYRRRPAFLIATVDKFATLPWVGASGDLLGRSGQGDADSLPPDLIIQDELHLISGPLGTMAGLYETAIEALCMREVDGQPIKPKIVASTATVRRAGEQIQALFARGQTQIFPPPGPSRHDSFLARTSPASESSARRYIGIGAQGRNPKVILRRTWTALMAAAQKAYMDGGGYEPGNPADPYMTVLGYFNSLRELGGSRRILEEEVQNTLKEFGGKRRRINEKTHLFQNRRYWKEVVELTSRVATDKVALAKQRLGTGFETMEDRVDSAIATNMISVGLDISRLGLMVVMGQPKTHSEYIQATSRVGRDHNRPGLVVTLLNVHKPRDRSHYERFRQYHETFYRMVEVASVTPFSSRALDRGLAGAFITLARHKDRRLTPAAGVREMEAARADLAAGVLAVFESRVRDQCFEDDDEREQCLDSVRHRLNDLMDSWIHAVRTFEGDGEKPLYQKYEPGEPKAKTWLLRDMLETEFGDMPELKKFRVNRSLRDVEPVVNVMVKDLVDVEAEKSK